MRTIASRLTSTNNGLSSSLKTPWNDTLIVSAVRVKGETNHLSGLGQPFAKLFFQASLRSYSEPSDREGNERWILSIKGREKDWKGKDSRQLVLVL
jgi:hypothetical protein